MLGQPAKKQHTACPQCGAEINQTPGAGRPKVFCKPSHGRTWRTRMRSAGWL
ncbi:hypothetical protein [Streptomyces sp. OR43]|uniref:hypothetical protein n=1 Tax=Streptomyces sp. or43 TaxID=2478957 RepID=UPI001650E02E|nr:hypothetical protein [Streptomyces sp. or43]